MFKPMFRQGEARLIRFSPFHDAAPLNGPQHDPEKNAESTTPEAEAEDMDGVAGKRKARIEKADTDATKWKGKVNRVTRVSADRGANGGARARAEATATGGNVIINNVSEKPERIDEAADRALVAKEWQKYTKAVVALGMDGRLTRPQMINMQKGLVSNLSSALEARGSHFAVYEMKALRNPFINPVIYQKESFVEGQRFVAPDLKGMPDASKTQIAIILGNAFDQATGTAKNANDLVADLNGVSAIKERPLDIAWAIGNDGIPMPVNTRPSAPSSDAE